MYQFLGITKIEKTPNIDLHRPVEVSGTCRIVDSKGNVVTLDFSEVSSEDVQAIEGLEYVEDESSPDGEVLRGEGIMLTLDDHEALREHLMMAVDRIEHDAMISAEAAWREVWVNAAVEAEARRA